MDLYKIISETLAERFPNYWEEDGVIYTNAAARSRAINSGEWHPLRITPPPVTPDGTVLTKHYHLEDGFIILDWIVNEPGNPVDANIE